MDTKPVYYGTPNEVAYLLFCDSSQGLGFCPFGEVIRPFPWAEVPICPIPTAEKARGL